MLNTLDLLFFNSSLDESRSISEKFLMNLSRSQGLFILVFYLLLDKTVSDISFFIFSRFQFDLMDAEHLIHFHNLALL